MYLEDISQLKSALKLVKADKIKLLHQLIFEKDEARSNRKNLRKFEGFSYDAKCDEFTTKLQDVTSKFSKLELIAIANLMAIEVDGTEDELANRILTALTDFALRTALTEH